MMRWNIFFDAGKPHWTAWSRVQMVDEPWEEFRPGERIDAFPLYYASLGGFYDLAESLIGKHPEHIDSRGGWMETPFVAAVRGKHFQVADLLHRYGADVNVRNDSNNTPLRVVCWHGLLDTVDWLLDNGADANARGIDGYAPIHCAAQRGHLQVCQKLIEHNAVIHDRNDFGHTPLHVATSLNGKHDRVDIMQVLLDHGADPNARDNDGSTPLHLSSWWEKGRFGPFKGTIAGTRLLLEHGAIIDAEDNEGRTPLQLALEHKRPDIAACLTEHGATR